MRSSLGLARALALLVPAGLLAGAFAFEHFGGLYPCEMCWWQRYAHMAGLGFAIVALLLAGRLPDRGRSFVWLAALGILASGVIGFYHAGVELGWFEGFTQCASAATGSVEDILNSAFNGPVIRCDEVQWAWAGISMAGWNAILSVSGALVILWLSLKRPPAA